MKALNSNFEDFLRLLNQKEVNYLIIGGYAVAMHGFVRATGDLDVFVERSSENAGRLAAAVEEFGFPKQPNLVVLLQESGRIVRFGVPPVRIELLNEISGVSFNECFAEKTLEIIGDLRVPFINLEHLLKNKRASGRLKDLADVAELSKPKKSTD